MPLFDSLTPETILERILSRMDTELQTREGSYAYDQAAPVAFEIWRALMTLGELIDAFYVNEHSGHYLDEHARLFTLSRREGARAEATLTAFGRDGVTVPAGTAFFAGGLEFRLEAELTIQDGRGEGLLRAAQPGQRYNLTEGMAFQLLRAVPGLERVEAGPAQGGADPESDKALFERLDEKRKRPSTSGNVGHYREWALSVDGVGAVRVTPLWKGLGAVRVLIAGYDRRPVDKAVAETLLGVSVKVVEIFGEYRVELEVDSGGKLPAGVEALKRRLGEIMPAHLGWGLVIPVLARVPILGALGPRVGRGAPPAFRPRLPAESSHAATLLGTRRSTITLPMAAAEEV